MKAKDLISYVLIVLVVVLIRTFIITPIKVNGPSMNATLEDGDIMLLKKYEKNDIERFDIVVVDIGSEKIIKRVIGMPNEDIEYSNGTLLINGEEIEDADVLGSTADFKDYCGDDEYFVMGDNRENSYDSRKLGCIPSSEILGTTSFIVFPFNKWGSVK